MNTPVFNDFLQATGQVPSSPSVNKKDITATPLRNVSNTDLVNMLGQGDFRDIRSNGSPSKQLMRTRNNSTACARGILDDFNASCQEVDVNTEAVDKIAVESPKYYSESQVIELLRRQHTLLTEDSGQAICDVNDVSLKYFLKVTPLNKIYCHEEILPDRVQQFYEYVLSYGLNNPICIPAIIVDVNTNVIIDGHHRYYTLQRLGLQEVEVLFIDYMNENIIIQSSANITKDDVIQAARSGKLLRPKLSRHLVLQKGKHVPILCISTIISFVLKIVLHQI